MALITGIYEATHQRHQKAPIPMCFARALRLQIGEVFCPRATGFFLLVLRSAVYLPPSCFFTRVIGLPELMFAHPEAGLRTIFRADCWFGLAHLPRPRLADGSSAPCGLSWVSPSDYVLSTLVPTRYVRKRRRLCS